MTKVHAAITPNLGTNNSLPVALNKASFDAAIDRQGYDIYIDRAIKCPCHVRGSQGHLTTCRNCGSTGWLFVDRREGKALLTSMGWSQSYKEWSAEDLGNVSITTYHEQQLSFMDRLVVRKARTIHKELVTPFILGAEAICRTTYPIVSMEYAFLFVGDNQKLQILQKGIDYQIKGSLSDTNPLCNESTLTGEIPSETYLVLSDALKDYIDTLTLDQCLATISLVYQHQPQYHITHLLRDTMISIQLNGEKVPMPISAVGRRSHYILDAESYVGDRLLNNDTLL